MIALQLSRVRQKPLLTKTAREFLADFGPTIAIFGMTAAAWALRPIELEHLAVPHEFATTSGRPWLVDPMAAPTWFWFASIPIAGLAAVLLFLDQNITVRLVNNPQHRLRKGAGYNLDMAVIAVLVAVCAVIGLPWVVAATVRSLNHVRSLATVRHHARGEHIISVMENRLTPLVVHLADRWLPSFPRLAPRDPHVRRIRLVLVHGYRVASRQSVCRPAQALDHRPDAVPPYALHPARFAHGPSQLHVDPGRLPGDSLVGEGVVLRRSFPTLYRAPRSHTQWLWSVFSARRTWPFLDADENPEEEQYREMD